MPAARKQIANNRAPQTRRHEPAARRPRRSRRAARAPRAAAPAAKPSSPPRSTNFPLRGFEAARLDDVAKRAGVAKGTIYLYFRDKESLFQELIRTMLTPLVGTIEALGKADLPMSQARRPHRRSVRARSLRDAAQGRHPPDDLGRAALSQARRILLPRGAFAHHRRRARAAAPRRRARGGRRRARRISADHRRAGPGRHHLGRTVRALRAARRARHDEDACGIVVWRRGGRHETETCRRLARPGARER